MRRISIFLPIVIAGLLPTALVAQGAPAAGAQLATEARRADERAGDKAALSDQWKKGARMAADGEKMVQRSERHLTALSRDAKAFQARADRALADRSKEEATQSRGRQMIDEGHGLQAQAEANLQPSPRS
jgi:hypothetical protein